MKHKVSRSSHKSLPFFPSLSLQSRLSLIMWFIALLSTSIASFIMLQVLSNSHKKFSRQQLLSSARELIAFGLDDFETITYASEINTFIKDVLGPRKSQYIVRIFDSQGSLAFSSLGKEDDYFPTQIQLHQSAIFQSYSAQNRYYESYVTRYGRNAKKNYLQVITVLPKYSQLLKLYWKRLALLLIAQMIFALLLAYLFSRKLVQPISKLAKKLENFQNISLEKWPLLEFQKGAEFLNKITRAMNTLLERIKKDVYRTRQMNRYIAHEMRTPLTILQGEAENLLNKNHRNMHDYEEFLKSSLEEIHRLEKTVQTMLKIEGGKLPEGEADFVVLELKSWLQNEIPLWQKKLSRQILFRYDNKQNYFIRSDAGLLFQLIDNLIRNIEKHVSSESICQIDLKYKNNTIILEISDSGSGMSASQLKQIQLGDLMKMNSGIGIQLCHIIAEILQIKIMFMNEAKSGLKVALEFSTAKE